MKSVLLIGLGRFGNHIAEKLNELHHQVMAVDKNEQRINDALPLVTDAQIGTQPIKLFCAPWGWKTMTSASSPSGMTFRVP